LRKHYENERPSFLAARIVCHNGRAVLRRSCGGILRPTGEAGKITLKAEADGLKSVTTKIQTN
jgi:hypothetical protein